jgi:hypothetical protein
MSYFVFAHDFVDCLFVSQVYLFESKFFMVEHVSQVFEVPRIGKTVQNYQSINFWSVDYGSDQVTSDKTGATCY